MIMKRHLHRTLLSLVLLSLVLAACGTSNPPVVVRETVAPVDPLAAEPTAEAVAATTAATLPMVTEPAGGAFTTPHPILGDVRVRRALAYCVNRIELLRASYPYLSDSERQALLVSSFVPNGHWALAPDVRQYPFDPEQANALLEAAGWKLPVGQVLGDGSARVNDEGVPLALKLLSYDDETSRKLDAVLTQQLLDDCGIQIIRTEAPPAYVFGARTGIQVRDFELVTFYWIGLPDPGGVTLYACDQIPLPENNWEGQNTMGWCNPRADAAIKAANNTLDRDRRRQHFADFQREFAEDMVSIPLFQGYSVVAHRNNLQHIMIDPTESVFANVDAWRLQDGGDTAIVRIGEEPDTLWTLISSSDISFQVARLLNAQAMTTYGYDYQPQALKQLPTLDNGGATNSVVEVTAGDLVWTAGGVAEKLAPGVEVVNADGELVTYEQGTLQLNQLTVTFEYVDGIRWEDGQPLKKADFELGNAIDCDPESGSVTLTVCESRASVEFLGDTSYRITYLPGSQWPEYFAYTLSAYPAHRVLRDGRRLAEVPVQEWASLPEVADQPLSTGPYRLVAWEKGQRLQFEANPYYYKGEVPIKKLTLLYIPESTQAVAQLLTGAVDLTTVAGPDQETVLEAAREGQIAVLAGPDAAWAHLDMNLYAP